MTTVKASCHTCGDCILPISSYLLVACTQAEWSYYRFTCPTCRTEVRQPADEEIQALLRSAGVPEELWIIPAEALEIHTGPAITADDVLDFALNLHTLDDAVRSL